MSKGFLVLAQNTDTVDYVQQAYALALSIKYSQSDITSISIATNDAVPKKYQRAFDQIIPIPWVDDTATRFRTENRWKLFHISPYEETIVLDTDMLMLDDIKSWWNFCNNFDLQFCSKITNYKLDTVVDTYHRKAFIANGLPSPYFALHYFKKTEVALNFYKTLEFVVNNWELCYGKFAPKEYQNWLSMDLASAIAIDMLGISEQVISNKNPMEFAHMKTPIQGITPIPKSWQDVVTCYLNNDGNLIVGNIKQNKLFHYVEKDFIDNRILSKLSGLAYGS